MFDSPRDLNHFLDILNVPENDRDRMRAIIPTTIKKLLISQDDPTELNNEIVQWVTRVLKVYPGFLYDQQTAAVFLGLNNQGFEKVKDLFKDALYTGILKEINSPQWWQTGLRIILIDLVESPTYFLPWNNGRLLPNITVDDYSKCYVCGKSYPQAPEILGYINTVPYTRHPMHLRCSVTNYNFEQRLFFDEIRMPKLDERE